MGADWYGREIWDSLLDWHRVAGLRTGPYFAGPIEAFPQTAIWQGSADRRRKRMSND